MNNFAWVALIFVLWLAGGVLVLRWFLCDHDEDDDGKHY
jgi:hypothetical protein